MFVCLYVDIKNLQVYTGVVFSFEFGEERTTAIRMFPTRMFFLILLNQLDGSSRMDTYIMIIIPCKDCICLPVCRHKKYSNLFQECTILHRWRIMNYSVGDYIYRYIIFNTIRPSRWEITCDGEIIWTLEK